MTEHPSIKTVFHEGQWWCKHFGVTGCGPTPEAAEADMWALYRDAVGIGKPPCLFPRPSRA